MAWMNMTVEIDGGDSRTLAAVERIWRSMRREVAPAVDSRALSLSASWKSSAVVAYSSSRAAIGSRAAGGSSWDRQ
ncbi:hypothetical protein D3C71_2094960 [compost metagenome]